MIALVQWVDPRLSDQAVRKRPATARRSSPRTAPRGDGAHGEELFGDTHDGALDELVERLKRVGIASDTFLPVPFDRTLDVCGVQYASAHALLRALEALRPELGLDDDENERDPRLARQRNLWKRFRRGAKLAIEKRLKLELVRF